MRRPVAVSGGRGRRRAAALAAAQQRTHPRLQLGEPEGLGEVVVGAEVETDHAVELAGAGGDDQDAAVEAAVAGRAAHVEAVHVGQPEVEDHDVGRLVQQVLERLARRSRST